MEKIILYYKFVPVVDPEAIRLWQKSLCDSLNLTGRIIISAHGINGTLGGDINDLKKYVKETKTYNPFKGMDFKWTGGARQDFPKLSIKVRDEIVTFDALSDLEVDETGIVGGGKRLKPQQVHQMVEQYGDDVVFLDGRSSYEAAIGKFKNAVVPEVRTAKDFSRELAKPSYQKLKSKKVITYCTGGVRCEVLTMLMKKRGFKDVYQMDGGIIKYGQKYDDAGLWEGSVYVFDGRMAQQFTKNSEDIGECVHCQAKTSNYENCANKACNELILVCRDCLAETTCSPVCAKSLVIPTK